MFQAVKEWGAIAVAISAMTAVATAMLTFIVSVIWAVWGEVIVDRAGVATAEDLRASREEAKEERTELKNKVDDLLRRVVVLARPEQIALYRDAPEVLGGVCYPGEECTIVVFAERDPRARECQLIPGRMTLRLTLDGRVWSAPRVVRGTEINLGASPQTVEPVFVMPRSVPEGEITGQIVAHYIDCFWQTDGEPPAVQESPVFKIHVEERGSP